MIVKTISLYHGIVKMTDTNERIAVLETQVKNIDEKVDDLKEVVKENHNDIKSQLKAMAESSTKQHKELGDRISNIEKITHGWLMWVLGASAVVSAIIGLYNTFIK